MGPRENVGGICGSVGNVGLGAELSGVSGGRAPNRLRCVRNFGVPGRETDGVWGTEGANAGLRVE